MKNMLMAITIFAAYLFGAATVYDVELSYNDNFTASQAIQSFIATADSISEVAFFCGRKINNGVYKFRLFDSTGVHPISAEISSDSAGLYAYKWVSATFNPKVPVRKGFKYQLHISRADTIKTQLLLQPFQSLSGWGVDWASGV